MTLLDIHLPDINGLDLMHRLRDVAPELDVLVISATREVETVRKALRVCRQGALRRHRQRSSVFSSRAATLAVRPSMS